MNKQKEFRTLEFLFLSTFNNVNQFLTKWTLYLNVIVLNLCGKNSCSNPSESSQYIHQKTNSKKTTMQKQSSCHNKERHRMQVLNPLDLPASGQEPTARADTKL